MVRQKNYYYALSLVSFLVFCRVQRYFLVSGFEELIALGRVINIQDDKKVQVLITYDHDFEKHRNDIMKNDREALQKIVLKSAIPSLIVSGVFNFG